MSSPSEFATSLINYRCIVLYYLVKLTTSPLSISTQDNIFIYEREDKKDKKKRDENMISLFFRCKINVLDSYVRPARYTFKPQRYIVAIKKFFIIYYLYDLP